MTFRLVRYFTLTSLIFFIVAAVGLGSLQRKIAIENMLSLEEAGNVNLTQIFSNSLWDQFDSFIKQTQNSSNDEIKNNPLQKHLYHEVQGMMDGLPVLKVKVFRLDGNTIFSTQASQIGADKSTNAGFLSAVKGVPASELTHRDTFSAFEQTIEDRDVISSYVPIYQAGTEKAVGVFEIYKDVTPLLSKIESTQYTVVGGVLLLLSLLYFSLFFSVRRAQKIIDTQQAEAEKTRLQMAQSEKMASLGQMVAGVAHELNTPLAFTRSNIELTIESLDELELPCKWGDKLLRTAKDSDKSHLNVRINNERLKSVLDSYDPYLSVGDMKEMLQQTFDGLKQMSELVQNLKDFTRMDRAKVSEFNVNGALDNVLYIAKTVIPESIQVVKEYGDIPNVNCMPSQINQVFLNLINNAAQSLGSDSDGGEIKLITSVEENWLKIVVADNGPGISSKDLPFIFDAFYSTKKAGEGTGLGLSIVKEIIDGHNGHIEAKSSKENGTEFTIRLPLSGDVEHIEPLLQAA